VFYNEWRCATKCSPPTLLAAQPESSALTSSSSLEWIKVLQPPLRANRFWYSKRNEWSFWERPITDFRNLHRMLIVPWYAQVSHLRHRWLPGKSWKCSSFDYGFLIFPRPDTQVFISQFAGI
jgi:hypothetical protein